MPPSDGDDFDQLAAEVGVSDEVDDFDALASEVGVDGDEPPPAAAPEREPGTGNWAEDLLLGLADGVTLGHGAELGRIGDSIGNALADASQPMPVGGKIVSGQRGVSDELYGRASETAMGQGGKLVGQTGMGALAALATGGGALGGVGAGALTGGLSAHGEDPDDLMAMLAGAGAGGALGAIGGGVSSKLASRATLNGVPTTGNVAQQIAGKAGIGSLPGGKLLSAVAPDWLDPLAKAGAGKVLGGAAKYGAGMGGAAAANTGRATGAVSAAFSPSKAIAQVAYGNEPTMSWAVQSVINSGSSQLDAQDEQRLTEAVMSGDPDRVSSTNFALQQKNPMYARRLQDELRSLQESAE